MACVATSLARRVGQFYRGFNKVVLLVICSLAVVANSQLCKPFFDLPDFRARNVVVVRVGFDVFQTVGEDADPSHILVSELANDTCSDVVPVNHGTKHQLYPLESASNRKGHLWAFPLIATARNSFADDAMLCDVYSGSHCNRAPVRQPATGRGDRRRWSCRLRGRLFLHFAGLKLFRECDQPFQSLFEFSPHNRPEGFEIVVWKIDQDVFDPPV